MKRLKSKIDLDDSSKRPKNDSDLVDMISTLPDSILGFILSFLPTKEAVWTSVLSKRWKLAWVMVQNLDFYYVGCWKEYDDDENMKFIRFVNRVLLVNDVGLINKFSLVWHPWCNSSHCSSWINTAITRNVRHLSLSGEFDLPISVFSCDSLLSLELKGRIYVPDTFVVCLPRLERLELDGVDFKSEEAFEKLINGCSMLYYLCLDIYSNGDDDFTYIISSASLRRFELCFKHKCSLKLKASSLEYIEIFGCMSETFVQENLSSLVGAYFSIHLLRDEFFQDGICNSIVEAVGAFDCGKALNLSADVMRPITRFHPGRVFNMLRRQSLRPDNNGMFVLQEAVLSSESEDQIYDIFQLLPPKIQVSLFTATMTPGPCEITREFMYKPVSMFVKRDQFTLMGTSHVYMNVQNENQKLRKLSRVFKSMGANVRIVIFVNTRRKVDWLTNKMRGCGRTVYAIHGDMDQNTRDIVEHKFHSSSDDVLITTNLFANVQEVFLVINYDLPTQPEKYLPCSGRFGRRKKGIAVSLTTPDEEKMVFEITRGFMNVLTLEGIKQFYINVENENQKLVCLSGLFQSLASVEGRIVVFVNTRRKVDWLTDKMSGRGHTVYAMRGDMDQTTRDIIMREFVSGSSPVLITTNLYAGIIDIQGLTLVMFNYDMPTQPEKYLHRIALFGGNRGTAVSITTPDEEKMVFEIQKFYNVEVEKWRV